MTRSDLVECETHPGQIEPLRIVWQETDPWPISCVHGVEFRARCAPWGDTLLAFLEGYPLREGALGEVVITIRRPDSRFSEEFLAYARKIIEQALRFGRLRHGPLDPQILAWFNA